MKFSIPTLIGLGLVSSSVFGSAIITVSGKLTSITSKDYVVEMPHSIYYINKKMVNPNVASKLTKTEIMVSVTVPMEAVDQVKTKE